MSRIYVLVLFMSGAAATPAPTTYPDPSRAVADMPGAIGRVLRLVRKLIDFGQHLAGTVRRRAVAPGLAHAFGTADLGMVLGRIIHGLRLAAALEARLFRRASSGRDLMPAPIRLPAALATRLPRQAAPPDPGPRTADPGADSAVDPRLTRLPSEAEIAAAVRRRPVGAVIADICDDLGIAPGQLDRAFWDEIHHAITMFGGSLARFLLRLERRLFGPWPGEPARGAEPIWSAASLVPDPRPP